MIAAVYRFANGMVMVFDEWGEQLPEYQGRWNEKREDILRDADAATNFLGANFQTKRVWSLHPTDDYREEPDDKCPKESCGQPAAEDDLASIDMEELKTHLHRDRTVGHDPFSMD